MMALVTIENATIDRMLGDPQFITAVPCLKNAAAATRAKSCSRCSKAQTKARNYQAVKDCIAFASSTQIRELKRLLNATKLRVYRKTTKQGKPIAVAVTL